MTVSQRAISYLGQLVATGLYGKDVEEAMERLICEALRGLLKEGFLIRDVRPEQEPGVKCPHCGSPKLNDISGMGETEFQCMDCRNSFKL